MKYRVFKKRYKSEWEFLQLFVESVTSYKESNELKNYGSVFNLIWYREHILSLIKYASQNNAIHHINNYLNKFDINYELLYDLSSLQKFAEEYSDNLPKKYVNDFFRSNGVDIPIEIDEGYTSTDIDNNLFDKVNDLYGKGITFIPNIDTGKRYKWIN